jgi:CheY-like chemotaxis protein
MSRKSLKVFVVEDEAMIRILVADMLGELGHTIAAWRPGMTTITISVT